MDAVSEKNQDASAIIGPECDPDCREAVLKAVEDGMFECGWVIVPQVRSSGADEGDGAKTSPVAHGEGEVNPKLIYSCKKHNAKLVCAASSSKGGRKRKASGSHTAGNVIESKRLLQSGCLSVMQTLLENESDIDKELNVGSGITHLYWACINGHHSAVQWLIERGADVNRTGRNGSTPLLAACDRGHLSVVELLIRSRADVDPADRNGWTPLLTACGRGHLSIVELLIRSRADVKYAMECNGWTPLYFACSGGYLECAQLLLEAGAEVDKTSAYGRIPLHVACGNGHDSVARWLIEAGADINKASSAGLTPLHMASINHRNSVVQILIESGADVNLTDIQ